MEEIRNLTDSTLRVLKLNLESDFEAWDLFLQGSKQVNPFSTSTFLQSMKRVSDSEVDIFVVARGEQWLGGIPVFWKRRFGQKAAIHPSPTPYVSVIYDSSLSDERLPSKVTSDHLLVSKVLAEITERIYSTVTHMHLPNVDDIRAWQWSGWRIRPFYTYILDLTAEPKDSSSFKQHVAKCQKVGCSISFSWDLERFWATVESMLKRQPIGLGMTKERFVDLAETLHEAGFTWMATAISQNNAAMASRIEVGLKGTSTVFDWVAGSSSEYLSTGVNSWLMNEVRKEARRKGFSRWDLCGANVESVAKFKSGLGGQLVHGFQVLSPRNLPDLLYQLYQSSYSFAGRVKQKLW